MVANVWHAFQFACLTGSCLILDNFARKKNMKLSEGRSFCFCDWIFELACRIVTGFSSGLANICKSFWDSAIFANSLDRREIKTWRVILVLCLRFASQTWTGSPPRRNSKKPKFLVAYQLWSDLINRQYISIRLASSNHKGSTQRSRLTASHWAKRKRYSLPSLRF